MKQMDNLQEQYRDSKNPRSVEDGTEFEDFACEKLASKGIIVRIARSRKYQTTVGDSAQGLEFKLDRKCLETNRLSIEYGERVNLSRPWVDSGILKEDGCWAYVQGNFSEFWVFGKTLMVMLYQWGIIGSTPFVFHEKPTIRTFYLPLELADEVCILKYPRDWT
jgi:hypothetical protein